MNLPVSPPVPLIILAGASTAAVGAAWIVTRVLRRKSAALRHFIWLLALVAPLAALPLAKLHTRVDLPILPRSDAQAPAPVLQVGGLIAPPSTDLPADPFPTTPERVPDPQTDGHAFNPWWAIWIAGAAFEVLRICLAHTRLRRLAGTATAAASPALLDQLNGAKSFFRFNRPVRILLTPQARLPFCYGVFRPVIIFPEDSEDWPGERTRVCLTHEMAHIVRGDLPAMLAAQWTGILCWFNPLVWIAARILRDEAENAADDLVLSRDIPPETYASNLVAITEECRAFNLAPGFALSIARSNRLTPRVVAILDSSLYRKSPRLGTIVGVSLLAGGALVALMTVRLTPVAAPLPGADTASTSGVTNYAYETNPQKVKPKLYNWEVTLNHADSRGGPYEILQVTSPAFPGSAAQSANVLIAPEMIIPNSTGVIDFMLYLGEKEPARDPAGYMLQPIKYSGEGSETGAASKVRLPGSSIDQALPAATGTKLIDGRLELIQFITTDDRGKKFRTDVLLAQASAFPQFGKREPVTKIASAINWAASECSKPMTLPGNYEASTGGKGSYTIRCLDLPESKPGHNIITIAFQASSTIQPEPPTYLRRMPMTINGFQATWGIYKIFAAGMPILRKETVMPNFLPRRPLGHAADYIVIRIEADSQEIIDRLTPVAGGILRDAD